MFDRVVTCSDRGDGQVNEDLATVRASTAWVLDGATTVLGESHTPAESDAAWYVDRLDYHLSAVVGDEPLEEATWEAIEAVRREYESIADPERIDTAALPAASGVVTRLKRGTLEYLVLGDCSVTVRRDEEVNHVSDGRLAALEEPILDALGDRIDAGEALEFARDAIWDQVQSLRKRANTRDEYWTFSLDPTAAAHAATGSIDVDTGDEILLSTDGFDRLVTTFDAHEYWGDLLEIIDDRSIEGVVEHLRTLEADDPEAREATRIKRHDDATAAWLTVG